VLYPQATTGQPTEFVFGAELPVVGKEGEWLAVIGKNDVAQVSVQLLMSCVGFYVGN